MQTSTLDRVPPRHLAPGDRTMAKVPAGEPGQRASGAPPGLKVPAASSQERSRGRGLRRGPGRTRRAAPRGRGRRAREAPAGWPASSPIRRRASWPFRFPATRPVSKSRPRLYGYDGRGSGALGPPSRPGNGPSRSPAALPWRTGCPSAPSRRRHQAVTAVARPQPGGTPSPA